MNNAVKHEQSGNDREAVHTPEPAHAHTPGSYDPPAQGGDGRGTIGEAADIDDVLDVEGVARLLRIGRNTIYDLVGRNEIPHRRLGKQIRFSRAAIMRWLDPWSSQGAKEGQ
jgi:excisionase family DNA binding protein